GDVAGGSYLLFAHQGVSQIAVTSPGQPPLKLEVRSPPVPLLLPILRQIGRRRGWLLPPLRPSGRTADRRHVPGSAASQAGSAFAASPAPAADTPPDRQTSRVAPPPPSPIRAYRRSPSRPRVSRLSSWKCVRRQSRSCCRYSA